MGKPAPAVFCPRCGASTEKGQPLKVLSPMVWRWIAHRAGKDADGQPFLDEHYEAVCQRCAYREAWTEAEFQAAREPAE